MFGLLPLEASEPWDEIPRLSQASTQEQAYRDSLVHQDLNIDDELRRALEGNSPQAMVAATILAAFVATAIGLSQVMSEHTPLGKWFRSVVSAPEVPGR